MAFRRRGKGGLLSGLWEYPNEVEGDLSTLEEAGHSAPDHRHGGTGKHIFSPHQWHMTALSHRGDGLETLPEGLGVGWSRGPGTGLRLRPTPSRPLPERWRSGWDKRRSMDLTKLVQDQKRNFSTGATRNVDNRKKALRTLLDGLERHEENLLAALRPTWARGISRAT